MRFFEIWAIVVVDKFVVIEWVNTGSGIYFEAPTT
jgi:hypothetical protein